ncbi:MAG: Bpu10I family restriction endonuclease [Muribaculum sp.]|nr:Bpu10I family restriction endonuclease [Muribaculum sp.]
MDRNNQDFQYIVQQKALYPQLCHASNIISQNGKNNLNAQQQACLDVLIPQYALYLRAMLNENASDQQSVIRRVSLLNTYYNFIHDNGFDLIFPSTGKFRPTILEEFMFLLFKSHIEDIKARLDPHDKLRSGFVKAYSNIYFNADDINGFINSPKVGVNTKDQDYAIYRSFDISINGQPTITINIPCVAIEVKTYIDKTMLDTIIATAEKIKSGNPHSRFVAVAETYDVSLTVDPAYSRIDQIYILRKSKRSNMWRDIDSSVVWRLYHETVSHLNQVWANISVKLSNDGIII